MPITVELTFSDEFVQDLLTTAFEGGIDYWCDRATNIRTKEYFQYKLYDAEDCRYFGEKKNDFPQYYDLTPEMFAAGLRLYLTEYADGLAGPPLDSCSYDSEQADLVIQLAVFGEHVFA
jgi:hypothetical protein